MADMKRVVVLLLIITLVLSAISVVFNLMVYNMKTDNKNQGEKVSSPSNSGNLGLIVERSSAQQQEVANGG